MWGLGGLRVLTGSGAGVRLARVGVGAGGIESLLWIAFCRGVAWVDHWVPK